MKINKKGIALISVILFIILGVFIGQSYAKKYLKDMITEKIPPHYKLKYTDLDINILLGNVSLNNALVKIKNKEQVSAQNAKYHTFIKIESLQLNDINYRDLLFNKTLTIKTIKLKSPQFHYYPYQFIASKKEVKDSLEKGLKLFNVNKIAITNGSLAIMQKSTDSIKMALSSCNLTVSGTSLDLKSKEKIPFVFDNYEFEAQKVVLDNNKFEKVTIDTVSIVSDKLKLANLQIIPKYSKKELSKHLKKERDYIKLKIPQFSLEKFKFDIYQPRLSFTAASGEIRNPDLEIYRDKLIDDDLRIKPLYSKMLRNLSFNLKVNELKIKNGYISYAELVDPDKVAGKLFFDRIHATLYEISNLKKAKKTEIKIKSRLMGAAPLTLNWTFDVNNTADVFAVNGSVSNLEAQLMNPFFQPNLNALAEGTLEQMYFSFDATNVSSKGEMKMKYEDFNFKILRKDSKKVNKLLTAIGNIFIKKDSKKDPKDFRYGTIEAERDATKSFFNYLWINVKSGVVSTLTGNGKKE